MGKCQTATPDLQFSSIAIQLYEDNENYGEIIGIIFYYYYYFLLLAKLKSITILSFS